MKHKIEKGLFREIKHTLGLTHLHLKRKTIVQENFVKMAMYNFCSYLARSDKE